MSEQAEGRLYLFCVVDGTGALELGAGLEAISWGGLQVVAGSPPGSLETRPAVVEWVQYHAEVVHRVWQAHEGTVPMRFGTVFSGSDLGQARDRIATWLEAECGRLQQLLDRLRGRAEYGIEVLYDPVELAGQAAACRPELQRARERARTASPGQAYLLQQRYRTLLDGALETQAMETYRELFEKIRAHVEALRVEPLDRGAQDPSVLLKLSCLLLRTRQTELFGLLEVLERAANLEFRLTGPWPPYSFTQATEGR